LCDRALFPDARHNYDAADSWAYTLIGCLIAPNRFIGLRGIPEPLPRPWQHVRSEVRMRRAAYEDGPHHWLGAHRRATCSQIKKRMSR
jgi:hypothetical protein